MTHRIITDITDNGTPYYDRFLTKFCTFADITDIVADSEDYSSALPDVKMDTHDTCALFYSSGTTGFPKAIELTHYNLVNQCFVMEDGFAFDGNTVNVSESFYYFLLLVKFLQ